MSKKQINNHHLHYMTTIGVLHNILAKEKELYNFNKKYPDAPDNMNDWDLDMTQTFKSIYEKLFVQAELYDNRIEKAWTKNVNHVTGFEGVDTFFKYYNAEENRITLTTCCRYDRLDLLNYLLDKYPKKMQEITKKNNHNLFSAILDKPSHEEFEKYLSWALNNKFNINLGETLKEDDNPFVSNVLLAYLYKNQEKISEDKKNEIVYRTKVLLQSGLKLDKTCTSQESGKGILYYALVIINKKEMNELLVDHHLIFDLKEAIKCFKTLQENYSYLMTSKKPQNIQEYTEKMQSFFDFMEIASIEVQKEVSAFIQEKLKYAFGDKEEWEWLYSTMQKAAFNQTNNKQNALKIL